MIQIQNTQRDRTSLPWTHWLLRYAASNDEEAFKDLVWSVGGSPPYGGVSYEEVEAVYELLEEYRGPGDASAQAYEKVRKLIAHKPESLRALELFRIHDRIASSSQDFSAQDVERGAELAEELGHPGARAYFTLLRAELMYRSGEIPEAAQHTSEGLAALQELAFADPVYAGQLLKAAKNAVSFAALDGDFAFARTVHAQMERFGVGEVLAELHSMLGPPPAFDESFSKLLNRASNYLDSGDSVRALEWYTEAERLARAENDETSLCGLLGDKAVVFRRVGNIRRAIETNGEAINLSRKHGDALNLSRWNANLGALLMQRGEVDAAQECFREGLQAAVRSGREDQVSVAVGNWVTLLAAQQRFLEAIQEIDRAEAGAPDSPFIKDVLRRNKSIIYGSWASRA